jgi:cytochrome b pre-mRNA-processing protein 3
VWKLRRRSSQPSPHARSTLRQATACRTPNYRQPSVPASGPSLGEATKHPPAALAKWAIPMILRSFRRSAENRTIASLYGMIVAQARLPVFYADYGVPDTVEGRFDLIVLHMVLVLRRVARMGHGPRFGQRLFDRFCQDLDDNLREMGIGDLAVPKHMRRFGEAFYGRQAAYLRALDSAEEDAFENALARNILMDKGLDGAVRLARYARRVIGELDAREDGALLRGEFALPSPEAFADART